MTGCITLWYLSSGTGVVSLGCGQHPAAPVSRETVLRGGLVTQVHQNLNPSEECNLKVIFLFSAAKLYPELKEKENRNTFKRPLPCLASL